MMNDAVSFADEPSDEEFEWEEVHVPEEPSVCQEFELELSTPPPRENIEITLHTHAKKDDSK